MAHGTRHRVKTSRPKRAAWESVVKAVEIGEKVRDAEIVRKRRKNRPAFSSSVAKLLRRTSALQATNGQESADDCLAIHAV